MIPMWRVCYRCNKDKLISEFRNDRSGSFGKSWLCKQCGSDLAHARLHKKGVSVPYTKSPTCPIYFGVYVAERLLSKMFNRVEQMPMGNRGYDFICGKGKRIDSKCSTEKHEHGHCIRWRFYIEKNTTADYFACIAFDNRIDITPLYFWLIPGHKINHLRCFAISISNIDKWDIYRQPIDRMLKCCTSMREVVAT
jgi:hypothetical protein